MKSRLIAGVALLAALATDSANAQVGMPAYSWTGCYAGMAGGGNFGSSKHIYEGASAILPRGSPETNDFSLSGGIFGGTVGCGYQNGLWAFGAENDISWTAMNGSGSGIPPFNTLATFETKETWLDTLRIRGGVALNQWFFYGTGGFAIGDEGITACGPIAGCGSQSKVVTGWTAGVGAEYALWRGLSLKLEYLHVDFGHQSFADTPTGIGFFGARDITLTDNIVRAGVNYWLGSPLP